MSIFLMVCCVTDLLNELENCEEGEEEREKGGWEGVRRRRRESGEGEGDAGVGEVQEAEYTPEQKEAVDR